MVGDNDVDEQAERGIIVNQLVRILGRNGVIYEERMTEAQLRQFLNLAASETNLGMAFAEWTIEIVNLGTQPSDEQGQEKIVSGTTQSAFT